MLISPWKHLRRQFPQIVAIKEATGSLDQASAIAGLCDITILSGDDSLTLPLISVGAKGVISVASNVSPKKVLAITDKALKGDFETARTAHNHLFNLCRAMFLEPNPQPVKAVRLRCVQCPRPCDCRSLTRLLPFVSHPIRIHRAPGHGYDGPLHGRRAAAARCRERGDARRSAQRFHGRRVAGVRLSQVQPIQRPDYVQCRVQRVCSSATVGCGDDCHVRAILS